MKKASRMVIFGNTNPLEECVVLLKPQKDLDAMDDDEEVSMPVFSPDMQKDLIPWKMCHWLHLQLSTE